MLLTMKTIYADAGGLVLQPGESHDFATADAEALLAGGFATAVEPADPPAGDEPAGAKVVTPKKGGKGGAKSPKPADPPAG